MLSGHVWPFPPPLDPQPGHLRPRTLRDLIHPPPLFPWHYHMQPFPPLLDSQPGHRSTPQLTCTDPKGLWRACLQLATSANHRHLEANSPVWSFNLQCIEKNPSQYSLLQWKLVRAPREEVWRSSVDRHYHQLDGQLPMPGQSQSCCNHKLSDQLECKKDQPTVLQYYPQG